MSKPVVLQMGPYPEWDQTPLDAAFTLHRLYQATDRAALLAQVGPKVRAIATRGDLGASAEIIEACPALELIAIYGVGYDAVDMGLARARGIAVTNTPDVLTDDVADLAVGMVLALARGIVAADAWVRDGSWAAKGAIPLRHKVSGRRVGILGLGRIGQAIARRLEGFDMEIGYWSRAPKPGAGRWTYVNSPVALARESDVLVVALAATPQTRHIVGAEVIEALGPQGMIVNISRAANLDETALLDALEGGRLGGAALDVFEGEPHLNPRFLTAPNVLLQPHHGSGTVETRRAMGQLMRDNLTAHFAGRPLLTPVPEV
jgi:lactate dehydrogenase-like 2-hydroxyacid dehydrogenase